MPLGRAGSIPAQRTKKNRPKAVFLFSYLGDLINLIPNHRSIPREKERQIIQFPFLLC